MTAMETIVIILFVLFLLPQSWRILNFMSCAVMVAAIVGAIF